MLTSLVADAGDDIFVPRCPNCHNNDPRGYPNGTIISLCVNGTNNFGFRNPMNLKCLLCGCSGWIYTNPGVMKDNNCETINSVKTTYDWVNFYSNLTDFLQ